MTTTAYRSLIGKEDIKWWDGVSSTYTRLTSTGGSLTLTKLGGYVDVAAVYGAYTAGALSEAITAAGSTNYVPLYLAPGDWTIDASITVPSNIMLIIPYGAKLTRSSGTVLTINKAQIGLYRVFWGTGTTVFNKGACEFYYPEWFGAEATGDAVTDSGPYILECMTACPDGAWIKLQAGGYYNAATELAFGSTNFFRFSGPASIYYGGAAKCISVESGVGVTHIHHTLEDLYITASSGNERVGANQIGIYIEDSCLNIFRNILITDLYYGIKQVNVDSYCEQNKFHHVEARNGLYCWYFAGVAAHSSMATTDFDHISGTTTIDSGVCFYVAENTSLYRSRFHGAMFPRADSAIGVYWDGEGKGITGSIGVEGTASVTGNVGWYFGEHANNLVWTLTSNVIGCDTDIDFHASATAYAPGLFTTTFGRTMVVQNGVIANIESILDEDGTTYYLKVYKTAAGQLQFQTDGTTPFAFRTIGDTTVYAPVQLNPIVKSYTATDGDTTPSVSGIGILYLSNSNPTTITSFDDPIASQVLIVNYTNANTTLTESGNIGLRYNTATTYNGASGSTQMFFYNGSTSKWVEVARCLNT